MFLLATLINLALLTTDKYPESSKKDDELLKEALHEYNIKAQSVDWNAPDTIWSQFDAALVYSTWDYYENHPKFLALLNKLQGMGIKVYNPPSIIEWNSCKTYLKDLEKLGLKTIDSIYLNSNELDTLQSIMMEKGWDQCVIKPQISTSGHHTYRCDLSTLASVQNQLKNFDEKWIVQPFVEEIITEGEWSFVFIDNEYTHCLLKRPLAGEFLVQKGEKIFLQPAEWMIQEAQSIVQTINLPILQMRVDVIRRGDELHIMEVEMIEPSLYLKWFPGSEKKLAKKLSEKLRICLRFKL